MRLQAITTKLLALVIGAILISAAAVVLVADHKITEIIDKSQNAIYGERVSVICQALRRKHERLLKTGLVEAYQADFQKSAMQALRKDYYTTADPEIYPFVIDQTGSVILHPLLPKGDTALQNCSILERLGSAQSGDFIDADKSRPYWYKYQQFKPWNWVVCYAVPLEMKYANAYNLRTTLAIIIGIITILTLFVLSILLTRFTRPIVTLTHASAAMADGNLEQEINAGGKDELGTLARSFIRMRHSIEEKIKALNNEIHERTAAQKKLQKAQLIQQMILDGISDVLLVVNRDRTLSMTNRTGLGHCGGPPAPRMCYEIFGQNSPCDPCPLDDVATSKTSSLVEQAHCDAHGHEHPYEMVSAPLFDEEGQVTQVVELFRDISARRDAEKEQERLEAVLRQSEKMDAIGQLAGGVAHDFNNMLGGIMGAAELLQKRVVHDPKAENLSSIILQSATHAANLTQQLLAFARSHPRSSTPVNVHTVLEDTSALLRSTIDRRIEMQEDLSADRAMVIGDSSQLQNAFLNLGINASQAMLEGGLLKITSSEESLNKEWCRNSSFDLEPGDYLRVEFRDTGCGIPEHVQKHIFEPFFTTKETGKGTGLGLSAVHGIIQQHGGAISVSSQLGKGTSFVVHLPLAKLKTRAPAEAPPPLAGSGRILVIDDEHVIRTTAKATLEDLGYEVILAENGEEGLAIFKEEHARIDAVILDMIMPRMNGRDCFAALKKIKPEARIILASGFAREEDVQELKERGLFGLIRKPYRTTELSRLLTQATHR